MKRLKIVTLTFLNVFFFACTSSNYSTPDGPMPSDSNSNSDESDEAYNEVSNSSNTLEPANAVGESSHNANISPNISPLCSGKLPDDTKDLVFFVGVSKPVTNERDGRDSARVDVANQASLYIETKVSVSNLEKQVSKQLQDSGIMVSQTDIASVEKLYSENVIKTLKIRDSCFVRDGDKPFTYYLLMSVDRAVIEVDGYRDALGNLFGKKAVNIFDEIANDEFYSMSN